MIEDIDSVVNSVSSLGQIQVVEALQGKCMITILRWRRRPFESIIVPPEASYTHERY